MVVSSVYASVVFAMLSIQRLAHGDVLTHGQASLLSGIYTPGRSSMQAPYLGLTLISEN